MALLCTGCHRVEDEVIVDLWRVGHVQLCPQSGPQFADAACAQFKAVFIRMRRRFVAVIAARRARHLDVRAKRRADRVTRGKGGKAIYAGAIVAQEIDGNIKTSGIKRIARDKIFNRGS